MVASLRRAALLALAGTATAAVGASWVAVVVLGATGDGAMSGLSLVRVSLAHLGVLVALVLASRALARRSSGVLERVFDHEDQLVRSIAHEVRNPLSRIVVATDQGLGGDQSMEAALRRVSVDARGLDELVGDLLEAARVVTGAVPLPQEAVHLDELLATMPATTWFPPATTSLDLRPVSTTGSPRLIRLAVKNLMRNAATHGYRGGPGDIEVRVDATGITVSDRGVGVSEELLARLRGETPVSVDRALHGLGLVIASWVSEVHGGRLVLDSREGDGFEARLALPTTPTPGVGEIVHAASGSLRPQVWGT